MVLRIAILSLAGLSLSLSGCSSTECGPGTQLEGSRCVPVKSGSEYTCQDACEKMANVCGFFGPGGIPECTSSCLKLTPAERDLTCFRDSTCVEIDQDECGPRPSESPATDHTARCAAFCEPEGPGSQCVSAVKADCQTLCLEFLDGFSESCAACFLDASNSPYSYETWCSNVSWGRMDLCTSSCTGNTQIPSAQELGEFCDAFCAPERAEDSNQCTSLDKSRCKSACTSEFSNLSRGCVACALSFGSPPSNYSSWCSEESFGALSRCQAFCG